jgi:hypothetical protein
MNPTQVRLAFGAVYWRVAALVFVACELLLWRMIRLRAPWIRGRRRIALMLYNSPSFAIMALLVAAVVAVAADLIVRLLVRPMLERWHAPPDDASMGLPPSFHLASREAIAAETPARRSGKWRWSPGRLVRTNLRLWFFPHAWDAEPWSLPLGEIDRIEPTPAPAMAWGLVRGLPDRLTVRGRDGAPETFAVPDPAGVLAWFDGKGVAVASASAAGPYSWGEVV